MLSLCQCQIGLFDAQNIINVIKSTQLATSTKEVKAHGQISKCQNSASTTIPHFNLSQKQDGLSWKLPLLIQPSNFLAIIWLSYYKTVKENPCQSIHGPTSSIRMIGKQLRDGEYVSAAFFIHKCDFLWS